MKLSVMKLSVMELSVIELSVMGPSVMGPSVMDQLEHARRRYERAARFVPVTFRGMIHL
jgi:hypothetical protein